MEQQQSDQVRQYPDHHDEHQTTVDLDGAAQPIDGLDEDPNRNPD
jgi:hypothetical protein